MKEDNSRGYSNSEIDRILKEYAQADKDRRMPYSAGQPQEKSQPQARPQPQEKKKFVVHIDESIIDSAPKTSAQNQNNSSGGIYFSNYQRHGSASNAQKSAQSSSGNPQQRIPTAYNTFDRRPERNTAAAKPVSKKMSARKTVESIGGKAAMGFLAFIMISTFILSYIGLTCVGDMLAINRSDENVEVVIPPDSSYTQIIDLLKENGLIKRKNFCKVFTKYRKFDKKTYLSGTYYLNSKMGVEGMLKDCMAAPVTADTITLAFPEGWTISQIFEKLEKYDVCDSNKLYSAIKSDTYNTYRFISNISDNSKRYTKFEGYLFPDTYDFFMDADTNYVLKKFLDNFESKWEAEYTKRAEKLGLTQDEIVTIASIIQKEAANETQMKTISSIIHNRLKNISNFPTLGCDSTAIYISNYVTPVVGEAQGKMFYDNYDTSAVRGLPPGPICNPGIDALKAALYPEETDYYFFAHDNAGRIYTAKTLTEHRNNLVKIIKANKNS